MSLQLSVAQASAIGPRAENQDALRVVRCRSAAICIAKGPSRYQTMKLRSKYRNAANRVGVCPDFQKLDFITHLNGWESCKKAKTKKRRHLVREGKPGVRRLCRGGATAVGYL